jgi:hypothetical protein
MKKARRMKACFSIEFFASQVTHSGFADWILFSEKLQPAFLVLLGVSTGFDFGRH